MTVSRGEKGYSIMRLSKWGCEKKKRPRIGESRYKAHHY